MTTFLRFTTAVVLCTLLAACGGSGGGGGSSIIVPPPTNPPGGGMAQQSVQREDAQSGISGVQTARSVTGSPTSTYSKVRALRELVAREGRDAFFGPHARYGIGPCSNGQETSTTAGANNTAILEVDSFYDTLCTKIESKLVWTASQSGNNLTGPATSTQYSNSGAITEIDTMSITFYLNSSQQLTGFSLLLTSIVQNGVQVGEAGVACTVASTNTISCGVADANNVASGEVGANVSATVTTASNSSNTSMSMQVSAYQASAANALSIAAATLPFWTVSPAADQTQSVSISGSTTSTTISLTVTDSTNGGSLAISGSTSGSVTGTMTRTDTDATVATFTLDAFGNGTLTYGNGTQVQIVNYAVQG